MVLFAFFAAMAETERENIRDATLDGLTAAARKGIHGGRPPPVITADMLHTVLRRRANGESVEQIRPDLIIPTGKRKGQHPPSPASIYRALAEHDKAQAYPRPSTKPTPTSPPSRRVPDGPIIAGQPYPPDFRRLLRRPLPGRGAGRASWSVLGGGDRPAFPGPGTRYGLRADHSGGVGGSGGAPGELSMCAAGGSATWASAVTGGSVRGGL